MVGLFLKELLQPALISPAQFMVISRIMRPSGQNLGAYSKERGDSMYVYVNSEKGLWTVGFYKPNGDFVPESDHQSSEDAAKRVHYLNGGVLK